MTNKKKHRHQKKLVLPSMQNKWLAIAKHHRYHHDAKDKSALLPVMFL